MMDLEATKSRFEETGRNKSKWARAWGFDPERIRAVLRGRFPPKEEEIEALQKDGLYVDAA
jgi:hypothetical protein